jgi:hypothetical protein
MPATDSIKNKLIKQAVKKLKRLGFINVTEENITTDDAYKLYFKKILLLHLGQNKETDNVIHELLERIKGLMEDSKEQKTSFQKE